MPGSDSTTEIEVETIQPRSFFARIGGVYGSPGAAFEEIGRAPRVLGPIFIILIIGFLAGFLLLQFLDKEAMGADLLQQMAQRGGSQAQMDQLLPMMSIFVSAQIVVGLMLGGLINALIVAGYGKLFSAFSSARNTFKALFSISLYAIIAVSTIKYAALVLVAFLKRPFYTDLTTINFAVASNLNGVLSAVLGEDFLPKYLQALASYIDFFVIWMIALMAIGFSVASKKLTTKSAAVYLSVGYGIFALISAILIAPSI